MVRASHRRLVHLVLVLVVALASIQFASHSVRAEVTDPDLAAYLAAGGSLADLCLSGEAEVGHADCPLCREVDFVALAAPPPITEPAPLSAAPLAERVTISANDPPQSGLPPVRAPPAA